jgi:hypothetical protein
MKRETYSERMLTNSLNIRDLNTLVNNVKVAKDAKSLKIKRNYCFVQYNWKKIGRHTATLLSVERNRQGIRKEKQVPPMQNSQLSSSQSPERPHGRQSPEAVQRSASREDAPIWADLLGGFPNIPIGSHAKLYESAMRLS